MFLPCIFFTYTQYLWYRYAFFTSTVYLAYTVYSTYTYWHVYIQDSCWTQCANWDSHILSSNHFHPPFVVHLPIPRLGDSPRSTRRALHTTALGIAWGTGSCALWSTWPFRCSGRWQATWDGKDGWWPETDAAQHIGSHNAAFLLKGYLHISYHIVTYKIHIVLVQWLQKKQNKRRAESIFSEAKSREGDTWSKSSGWDPGPSRKLNFMTCHVGVCFVFVFPKVWVPDQQQVFNIVCFLSSFFKVFFFNDHVDDLRIHQVEFCLVNLWVHYRKKST